MRLVGVALIAALSGCSTTTRTVEPAPPQLHEGRTVHVPGASGRLLDASFRTEGNVVLGRVDVAVRCRHDFVVRPMRHVREDQAPSIVGNSFWIAAGAAAAVYGGVLVARSFDGPETDRAREVPAAIGLGAFGVAAIVTGLDAFQGRRREAVGWTEPTGPSEEQPGEPLPCEEKPSSSPYRAKILVAERTTDVRLFLGRPTGFVVPLDSPLVDHADVVLAESATDAVPEGTPIATIDLAPMRRWAAARRPVSFSGKLFESETVLARGCPKRAALCQGADPTCSGYHDVACGLRPGVLQWSLYDSRRLPLTLEVVGPGGLFASSDRKQPSSDELVVDRACRADDCGPRGTNVVVPLDRRPREGTWIARISPSEWPRNAMDEEDVVLVVRIAETTFHGIAKLRRSRFWTAEVAFAIGADRDRDGVVDAEDGCPDEPGDWRTPSGPRRGCPAPK